VDNVLLALWWLGYIVDYEHEHEHEHDGLPIHPFTHSPIPPSPVSCLTGQGRRAYTTRSFATPEGKEVRDVAYISLQDGESLENALRRFKRKVQQEDIIKEVKKHSFFLKPGEKKRIKQALARKRLRKKMRNLQRRLD
jgi:small subunit ribosomal protein S21